MAVHAKAASVTQRPAPASDAMRGACMALLLSACAAAHAQSEVIETTYSISPSEKKVGAQYREDVEAARQALMEGHDAAKAMELLQPALDFCQALRKPGLHLVSVSTAREYEEYLAGHAGNGPTEWVDSACPMAFKLKGYFHAGAKQAPEALEWLDRAIELAPYYADAQVERGFVLGQSGRLKEALEAYRHALNLAETHPGAVQSRPLALRGQGWVLTEMGDLDGAQRSYEASLEIEPDNALAKNELEYIAKLRGKRP